MFSFQDTKYIALNENKESKNLSKARHYLESNGYTQEKANQLINVIRSDIPASRMFECKFMLGICRMYINGEIDQINIQEANKTIKLLGNGHIDEYDNNLNGEHLETLINRFKGVAALELDQSKQESNNKVFTKNENYTIVRIPDFETASKYQNYTSWCITHDEKMYNSYTANGSGLFYFCLINGFENIEQKKGDNCPLDEYGLSMLAISVDVHGDLNTCTCRWNHDNGGNESVLNKNQIEDLLGVNFYQTFKPYTKEELKEKGIITPEDVEKILADPTLFKKNIKNKTIKIYKDYFDKIDNSDNHLYPIEIVKYPADLFNRSNETEKNIKYAFIKITSVGYMNLIDLSNNKLLLKQWGITSKSGFHNMECNYYIDIKINNKWNFINYKGDFLLKDGVDEFRYLGEYLKIRQPRYYCSDGNKIYFAVCLLNNKVNVICDDGTYLFDEWFDGFISLKKLVNLENSNVLKDFYDRSKNSHIFGIKKDNKYKFVHFREDEACMVLPEWVDSIKFVTEDKTKYKLECYLNNECIYTYDINQTLLLKGDDDYHIIGNIIVKSNNTVFNILNNGQLKYKNWIDLNKFNAKIDIKNVELKTSRFVIALEQMKKIEEEYESIRELFICQINNKYNIYDLEQDKMLLNESVDDIVYKNNFNAYILKLNNLTNIYVLPTKYNKHYIKNNGYAFKEWVHGIGVDVNNNKMKLFGCSIWDSEYKYLLVEDIHYKLVEYVACTQFDQYAKENPSSRKLKLFDSSSINESFEEIYDSISPAQINLKSFETKEKLNPKLWDENGELDPKVRKRLLSIAMDFYDSLNIETLPKDIIIVGSSAGYNWSKYSDIDLHLLIDFSEINDDVDLLKNYFNAKKITWTAQHNITIRGYEVELYVQPTDEQNASDGVYSLVKNEWIQIPKAKDIRLNKKLITHQAAKVINLIDKYIEEFNSGLNRKELEALNIKADKLYKLLFQNRRDGLKQFGEGATNNIVFKVLRRSGHLEALRDLKFNIYDELETI